MSTLGGPEPVAIFATSYFVASSTVTLVVSGFRGIYRPAFAHVMSAGNRAELRRAFDLINKVQVLAVIPAGAGLAVMVGDYLPLLYGAPFSAAIPIARVLVVLLFAETVFAVGLLLLWVDERYRAVLTTQAVMVAAAPLFIWSAARFGLFRRRSCWAGAALRPRFLATLKRIVSTAWNFRGGSRRRSAHCRCSCQCCSWPCARSGRHRFLRRSFARSSGSSSSRWA